MGSEIESVGRRTINVGGHSLDFSVTNDPSSSAFFCLGVGKSGSTLLHKIVSFLARRNQVNIVDIPGAFFRSGLVASDWMGADLSEIVLPGNIYSGFRTFPINLAENQLFVDSPKVFMHRDPRDALVSQYFSDAYSHNMPSADGVAKGTELFEKKRASALASDLDDYVLRQSRGIARTLSHFEPLLTDPTCLVLRYEDCVFQKKRLIYKIALHFGWKCHVGPVETLLRQVDSVPSDEDKTRFIRKVIPGDHRVKLKSETIKELDNRLRSTLRNFDYY